MGKLLNQINQPNDVKKIPDEDLPALCKEIRGQIMRTVSKNGGHLASNLGTVELTVALHRFLDLPTDKLVWDVGHQSYTHKLLTGRKEAFRTLRKEGGISGFPKRRESACDVIDTGHSSTSISVAAGLVKARDLKGESNRVVAVIGDGSLSGGPAYEALNNVGRFHTNMIIILNDNEMSISRNVGGMASYLRKVRMSVNYIEWKGNVEQVLNKTAVGGKVAKGLQKTKAMLRSIVVPGEFFTEMGLAYYGPIDGHNISDMEMALHAAEKIKGAVLIHVVTKKGKGYRHAEMEPSRFHGTPPFDIKSGKTLTVEESTQDYTDVFREEMVAIGKQRNDVVAITAAMSDGTGLDLFSKKFPSRFFDVGIAEGHAVSFATGLSLNGMHPVVAVYSTFLQRGFDEMIQDVCLNQRPVTFAIDRAGIVGSDGETHQGLFDLAYLSEMPGMIVMAPRNGEELRQMLRYSVLYDGPTAIRYPRGNKDIAFRDECIQEIRKGRAEIMEKGSRVAILFAGALAGEAYAIRDILTQDGIHATIVNARFVAPFDQDLVVELAKEHDILVTLEEGIRAGGFGEHVAAFVAEQNLPMRVLIESLPNAFLPQGNPKDLRLEFGLNPVWIAEQIRLTRRKCHEDKT